MSSNETYQNYLRVSAALGKFDIREDEERLVKLAEIVDILFSAGYYRAKIQGLDHFDKIVGGMVWCISLCARSVDVDLLYSENSTIGQKIALTEQIVKVLKILKCPFSLEPHQIQGLDANSIYPIIQWLVNEAKAIRNLRGDEMQNFAVYQFYQRGWCVENDEDPGVLPLIKKGRRKLYKRVIRMQKTSDLIPTKEISAESSTNSKPSVDPKLPEHNTFLIGAGELKEVDDSILILDGDKEDQHNLYLLPSSAEQLHSDLEVLDADETQLRAELIELEKRNNLLSDEVSALQTTNSEFEAACNKLDSTLLEKLKTLLAERDLLKSTETEYKNRCRSELFRIDQRLTAIKDKNKGTSGIYAQTSDITNSADENETFVRRINDLMAQLAQLDEEIMALERTTELYPNQIELQQYQKRFVELYNLISTKHGETKRQYTRYNNLQDIRAFIRRQIDLLNSIDDSRGKLQSSRDTYIDSFLQSLQQINRAIDESLDKILCRKQVLQGQHNTLHDRLQEKANKRNQFIKTVAEFQQECQRNENLKSQLERLPK